MLIQLASEVSIAKNFIVNNNSTVHILLQEYLYPYYIIVKHWHFGASLHVEVLAVGLYGAPYLASQ